MKSMSLRGKIVIMASMTVAVAGLFLTAISISSANKYMRSMISYDVGFSDQGTAAPPPSQGGIREDSFLRQSPATPPI